MEVLAQEQRWNSPFLLLFVLFWPSKDWMVPTHVSEGRSLAILQFEHSSFPKTPLQTDPEMMFCQLFKHLLTMSNWHIKSPITVRKFQKRYARGWSRKRGSSWKVSTEGKKKWLYIWIWLRVREGFPEELEKCGSVHFSFKWQRPYSKWHKWNKEFIDSSNWKDWGNSFFYDFYRVEFTWFFSLPLPGSLVLILSLLLPLFLTLVTSTISSISPYGRGSGEGRTGLARL